MNVGLLLKGALRQKDLPLLLRFYVLVPLALVFVAATGGLFTLPAGPLCDEGMVLFMEGGCDWGLSNVFFFSKLGALVAASFAFVVASRHRRLPWAPLLPHLLLLCAIGLVLYSGGRCDTYYSHPNGSMGQMALEIAAFAVLGLALHPFAARQSPATVALLVVLWNAFHIGAFYLWLAVTDHWTWAHTLLLCATLLAAAGLLAAGARRIRGAPAPTP